MDRSTLVCLIYLTTLYTVQSYRFSRGVCEYNEVMCKTGIHTRNVAGDKRCIKEGWVCDHEDDCEDRSDEMYCPYNFHDLPEHDTTDTPYLASSARISTNYWQVLSALLIFTYALNVNL